MSDTTHRGSGRRTAQPGMSDTTHRGSDRGAAQPLTGGEADGEQRRRGRITLFWLSVDDPQECHRAQFEWTDGERLAALPALVEKRRGCPALIDFPWWLLNDAMAFSRWGLRLRWESPICLEDELAILEAVTADAKRWRVEQARRQRNSSRSKESGRWKEAVRGEESRRRL